MSVRNDTVIALENVSRRFGAQEVLREVSFEVRRGETLVVIGESGCGKSVTLKLMMALLQPSDGVVRWSGEAVDSMSEAEIHRRRLQLGFLFQGAALFDSLNVNDNVAFGLRQNTNMSESEIEQVVVERLADVGLRPTVRRKVPAELSGGMRKRVGLARALALSPEVMFYDEPTTGLDPITSAVIDELIMATRERHGVTSVVVTHDMRTVQRVSDRVLMLFPLAGLDPHEEQIIFEGRASEAYDSDDPRVSNFVRGEAGNRLEDVLT